MSDKTKVHLVTLVIVDHDEMGAEEVKHVLEHTRYPNHCFAGMGVMEIRTGEVEWSDDHPLNSGPSRRAAAVADLFGLWCRACGGTGEG